MSAASMIKGRGKQPYRWDQTGLPINPMIKLLKTSDELDWSDINVSLINTLTNGESCGVGHQQALPDLRLLMALSRADVTATINGREQHVITPSGLPSIIPPETPWTAKWRNDFRAISVIVKRSVVAEVANELFGCDVKSVDIVPKFGVDDRGVTWMLHSLEDALDDPKGHGDLKVAHISRALVAGVLLKHSTSLHKCPTARDQLTARQVKLVADYIQQQLTSKILLKDLTALLGLSQTVFIQRFNASFGASPHRYVMETRVSLARKLLATSKLPIIEIAELCGFADQAYFTTAFKRIAGTSPARYRQMI